MVVEVYMAASTITLELPPELKARQIHPMFHVKLFRAHIPNDNERFSCQDTPSYYDFGATDEPKWFVDDILAHHWVSPTSLELQVCWTIGDVTWELLSQCKDLEALNTYLELHGVTRPRDLPHKSHQ